MADQTENAYQKQASLSVGGRKSKQYKMKGGKVRSTFHRSAPAAAALPLGLAAREPPAAGGGRGGAEGPLLCFRELGSASANSEQHRAPNALHLRLAAPGSGWASEEAGRGKLRSAASGEGRVQRVGQRSGAGAGESNRSTRSLRLTAGAVLAEHAVVQECWAGLQGETSGNPPCTPACSAHICCRAGSRPVRGALSPPPVAAPDRSATRRRRARRSRGTTWTRSARSRAMCPFAAASLRAS